MTQSPNPSLNIGTPNMCEHELDALRHWKSERSERISYKSWASPSPPSGESQDHLQPSNSFHKLGPKITLNSVAAHLYLWYYRYKARKLLNTALDVMRKARNVHPNTATILVAIGRQDLDSGDLHSAKLHLEETIDIQTKCCGPVHTQTLHSISSCWQKSLVIMEMNSCQVSHSRSWQDLQSPDEHKRRIEWKGWYQVAYSAER